MTTEAPPNQLISVDQMVQSATTELRKYDPQIQKICKEARDLKINGLQDKKGYETVSRARKDLKQLRCSVENTRKSLNEDAQKYIKSVNAEAKRITDIIKPVETELEKKEDDWTEAKEAEERRKREEAEARYAKRCQRLVEVDGFSELAKAKELSDAEFDSLVQSLADQKAIRDAERRRLEAEEAARKAEQERLEAEARLKRQKEIEEEERRMEAERRKLEDERRQLEEARRKQHEEHQMMLAEQARIEQERLAAEADRKRLEREAAEREQMRLDAIRRAEEAKRKEQERIAREEQFAPERIKVDVLMNLVELTAEDKLADWYGRDLPPWAQGVLDDLKATRAAALDLLK